MSQSDASQWSPLRVRNMLDMSLSSHLVGHLDGHKFINIHKLWTKYTSTMESDRDIGKDGSPMHLGYKHLIFSWIMYITKLYG